MRAEGWTVETFDSAEAFLARPRDGLEGCLVLDVTMPGLDGLELQRRLAEEGKSLPIVFVTGHGDIPMSVRAMKAGAKDFLTKPVPSQVLVAAIRAAIEQDEASRRARGDTEAIRETARQPDAARARGARGAGGGQAQQADCGGPGRGRADGQVPSGADHGANAGENSRGAHAYRRARGGRRRGGWRYLDYGFKSGSAVESLNFNGPALGVAFSR